MRILRRIIFTLALLTIMVCVVLLITAYDPSNPTYRRYSSEPVLTTGQAPSEKIGADGERILGLDLRIPNNNQRDPRQIVCNIRYQNQPPPQSNMECIYYSDEIENYRVPDFVMDGFIAEAKNAKDLLVSYERDFQQISEIALAAKELEIPFWLYVRHNTRVDDAYYEIIESTGGKVVHYFATDGYVNPVDFQLWQIIAASLGVMVVVLIWALLAKGYAYFIPKSKSPKSSVAISPHKSSRKAKQSFDDYDRFINNASDNARKTLDD